MIASPADLPPSNSSRASLIAEKYKLTKNSENYGVTVKNLQATSSFENSCVILNLYFCILNNCVPSINKTLPTDFTIDIFGRSVSMTIFNLSHLD